MTSPRRNKQPKKELPLVLESEPKPKQERKEYIYDEFDVEAYEADHPGVELVWDGKEYVPYIKDS